MPSTGLGRASAWLFVGAVAFLVLSSITPAFRSLEIGPLNVGPFVGVAVLTAAPVTGAIALIRHHERSWVVWLAVALPTIVIGAEIISRLIPGE